MSKRTATRRSFQAERFRIWQTTLGWTHSDIARRLGCTETTVSQWSRDMVRLPPLIADWLEACCEHRRQHPDPAAPTNWRRSIKWEFRPNYSQPVRQRVRPPKPIFAEILACKDGEDLRAEDMLKLLARRRRAAKGSPA